MAELSENDLAKIAVDCAYKIYMAYGPGLLESAYSLMLVHDLKKHGLEVERECCFPLVHNGELIDHALRADIVVNRKLIIEVKAIEELAKVHKKQLLTYLVISGLKLGLLINFGAASFKGNVERVVNGLKE